MSEFDVAVIGAGPTGLTLCHVLGQAGIRTLLIERNPSTVQEPRAVSIDDESLRTMQSIGMINDILKDVELDYGSHYFGMSGKRFLRVEPTTREFGFPRRNAFLQPRLENTLREGLSKYPHVGMRFETACESIYEDAQGVILHLQGKDGTQESVRVRYAVGSDGARSMVRKSIGAQLQGATYQQKWLIVDLASTRETLRQTRVECHPARPFLSLPGPHGARRYEFMLHDHEDEEHAASLENVRALLARHGPDADAPIVRRQVYTFHARMVDRWHTERVFLAGDAAHLTPPFAGQGMNSGVRDAHNLGWKLAAVTSEQMPHALLRTYGEERPDHAWSLIQLAVNMGRVMMPRSTLHALAVQGAFSATRLFPKLQSYFAEMKYKPKPHYRSGFFVHGAGDKIAGRMISQPQLEMPDGRRLMMDDVIGPGFALIAYGARAQATLAAAHGQDFGALSPARLAITPMRYNFERNIEGIVVGRDINDVMGRMAMPGDETLLLVRPDRYVAMATAIMNPASDVTDFVRRARELAACNVI